MTLTIDMGDTRGSSGDTPTKAQDYPKVHLLVTGFSNFAGISNNPTELLVSNLESFLKNCNVRKFPSNAHLTSCQVLKVSAKAVQEHLDHLEGVVADCNPSSNVVVLIHFGVDAGAREFKVEKQAYNEANFRLPDEDGWQPKNEPILESNSVGETQALLHTKIDVFDVVQKLQGKGFNVQVSYDPGRYVCNYTYYSSQLRFGERKSLYSLFVHVPPFSIIDENTQIEFVRCLLDELTFQLGSKHMEENKIVI